MKKKKIGILTILDVANFGTMLQAYALAKKIKELGHDVLFVDYWRKEYTTFHKVRVFLTDATLGNVVKRFCFCLATLFFYAPLRRRLRRFVTGGYSFTNSYHSIDGLLRTPPLADMFVCGSDQIWNTVYNHGVDRAFFLDFTDKPKISYAASMGIDRFSESDLAQILPMLRSFRAVSVRESQSADYLRCLGLDKVCHVLDPTLLMNADEWKMAVDYAGSRQKEPYLLVYSVERLNNDFIFSLSKRLASERGLKMYVVCTTYPVRASSYGFDRIFALADVKTFVRLLADADFIVASSFHGTAFAVNFKKDFITIVPDKYNNRIENFVSMLGLQERIVRGRDDSCSDFPSINYDKVDEVLRIERQRSLDFLRANLQ